MALLLPIARVSLEAESGARRSRLNSATPSMSPCPSDEDSSLSSLKLAVKNTFIDVETFESDEKCELPLHLLGAQTCSARLSQSVPFPTELLKEEREDDEEESTEAKDSELSDFEYFNLRVDDTPAADGYAGMHHFFRQDVLGMPQPGLQAVLKGLERKTVPLPSQAAAQQPQVHQAGSRHTREVRIPVEVAAATQEDAANQQVAVLSSKSETLGGCTILDLRIVVGPSGELRVLQTEAGQNLVNACMGSGQDGSSSAPAPAPAPQASPAHSPASTTALPPPPAALGDRRAARAKTASVEKSSMVCCHWKNKGWCKYQSSCRFMHPEHKRGVGQSICKGASAVGFLLQGGSPGGPPSGARTGKHAGGSSSRHFWPEQHSSPPAAWPGVAYVQPFGMLPTMGA